MFFSDTSQIARDKLPELIGLVGVRDDVALRVLVARVLLQRVLLAHHVLKLLLLVSKLLPQHPLLPHAVVQLLIRHHRCTENQSSNKQINQSITGVPAGSSEISGQSF